MTQEHRLAEIEERPDPALGDLGALQWRWRCTCGAVGRWTGQSDGPARVGFERHARRAAT